MNTLLKIFVNSTFPSISNRLLLRRSKRKRKKDKKPKGSYTSVASVGATCCSDGVRSLKKTKNWREAVKYLHRADRARVLRCEGSVPTCSLVGPRQEVEKRNACQQQGPTVAVGCCNCGAAYPSRVQRGGNREARRRKLRANQERLRDIRTILRTLATSLNLFQGGSDSRNPETTGKLQVLRDFISFSVAAGKSDQSKKDSPVYVGVEFHTYRIEDKN